MGDIVYDEFKSFMYKNNYDCDYLDVKTESNNLVGFSNDLSKSVNFKEAFIPGKNYEVISTDPETGRTLDVCEVIGEDGERYQFNEKYFKFVFKVMDDDLPSMVKFRLNKEISNKEIEELLLSDPTKTNNLYEVETNNEYDKQTGKNADAKNADGLYEYYKNTLQSYDKDGVSKINNMKYEDTPVSRLNPKKISPYQMVKINEEFNIYYDIEKAKIGIVECVCLDQCRVLFDSGISTWINVNHVEPCINGMMSTTNIDSQRSVYNSFKLNQYNHYLKYMNTNVDEFEDDEIRKELLYRQDIFDIVTELDKSKEIQENDADLIDELMITMIMRLDYLYRKNVCPDNDLVADLDILGSVEKSKFYEMICKYTLTSEPQKLMSYITTILDGKTHYSSIIIINCICMDFYMDINDIRQFEILKKRLD